MNRWVEGGSVRPCERLCLHVCARVRALVQNCVDISS